MAVAGLRRRWRRGGAGGALLFFDVAVVDVPVVQVVDVGRPVLGQGCLHALCVQTVLGSRCAENCGCSTVAVLGQGGDMPVVVNDRCSGVPQVQFLRLWTSL